MEQRAASTYKVYRASNGAYVYGDVGKSSAGQYRMKNRGIAYRGAMTRENF